jgi:hypothetical protein
VSLGGRAKTPRKGISVLHVIGARLLKRRIPGAEESRAKSVRVACSMRPEGVVSKRSAPIPPGMRALGEDEERASSL